MMQVCCIHFPSYSQTSKNLWCKSFHNYTTFNNFLCPLAPNCFILLYILAWLGTTITNQKPVFVSQLVKRESSIKSWLCQHFETSLKRKQVSWKCVCLGLTLKSHLDICRSWLSGPVPHNHFKFAHTWNTGPCCTCHTINQIQCLGGPHLPPGWTTVDPQWRCPL